MVEIKAVTLLEDQHLAQALNYLEASASEIGLLFNFGATSLQFKRLHNKKNMILRMKKDGEESEYKI